LQYRFDANQEQPPELVRLIHRSRLTIDGEPEAVSEEIRRILSWSREWNRRAGISGVLVTDLRMFAQLLEGPPNAVKEVFGHIACDTRHREVTLLDFRSASDRSFRTWMMAYLHTREEAADVAFPQAPKLEGEAENMVAFLRSLLDVQQGPLPS
jgi:hypothetical protein